MLYLMRKKDWQILGSFENLTYVKEYLSKKNLDENDYKILEETDGIMNYINKIVYVTYNETTTCIFNNKAYWSSDLSDVLQNFNDYTFTDIFGEKVSFERFVSEMNDIQERISQIDGHDGQIAYNQTAGKEFVAMFYNEFMTVKKIKKNSDESSLSLLANLANLIALLNAGAFREATQYMKAHKETIVVDDGFLDETRYNKYLEMFYAADCYDYTYDEE